jgi:hypothetical protein
VEVGVKWDLQTGLGTGNLPGPSMLRAWLKSLLSSVTLSPPLAHSVCQGRQWHCTGHRCSGRCQASGAPHYVTFDGLALTFPGACEYLLVREASGRFSVSAQNLPCGTSGLTCTKALAVRLESTVVHLLRGGCDIARVTLSDGGGIAM